jgi:hypothetical protein
VDPAISIRADHARVQSIDDDANQILGRHHRSLARLGGKSLRLPR